MGEGVGGEGSWLERELVGEGSGRCSQDIADSSDKGQMLTIDEMEVPLFGFTAMESDADSIESASLMLTISTRPRSTSWK